MQCTYKFENNGNCGAFAMNGAQFCFSHNPEMKALKLEAVRKGGKSPKKTGKEMRLSVIPINSKHDVVPFLVTTINEVRSGKMDVRKANALGYIAGVLVKAFELTEMQHRIEEIEKVVLEKRTRY